MGVVVALGIYEWVLVMSYLGITRGEGRTNFAIRNCGHFTYLGKLKQIFRQELIVRPKHSAVCVFSTMKLVVIKLQRL